MFELSRGLISGLNFNTFLYHLRMLTLPNCAAMCSTGKFKPVMGSWKMSGFLSALDFKSISNVFSSLVLTALKMSLSARKSNFLSVSRLGFRKKMSEIRSFNPGKLKKNQNCGSHLQFVC